MRRLIGRRDNYAGVAGQGAPGGFAGAGVNRLTVSLSTWAGSVNYDLDGGNIGILRARARQLSQSNEHGKRFLTQVATNVVGRANPRLQVRALKDLRNPDATTALDKAANDTVEIHWERWGKSCDLSGRHKTFYSLLRTAVKGVARDGEAWQVGASHINVPKEGALVKLTFRSTADGFGLQKYPDFPFNCEIPERKEDANKLLLKEFFPEG